MDHRIENAGDAVASEYEVIVYVETTGVDRLRQVTGEHLREGRVGRVFDPNDF